MIAIVNKKLTPEGISTYNLYINEDFIVSFKHKRSEGLAVCLKKASEAVEKQRNEDIHEIIKKIGGLDDEIEFVSFEEFKKKVGVNNEKTKTKS